MFTLILVVIAIIGSPIGCYFILKNNPKISAKLKITIS
jgi:hypothetical protein